jgi:hypothetical protein
MLLSLLHIIMVMNPVLKKRFIDSIEYLRKMGFFEDCANLTSNEIYRRVSRKIRHREEYLNKSDAELDYNIACLDEKRVFRALYLNIKNPKQSIGGLLVQVFLPACSILPISDSAEEKVWMVSPFSAIGKAQMTRLL